MSDLVLIDIPATAGAITHARELLQKHGRLSQQVCHVYSAGDMLSDCYDDEPRDTILWVNTAGKPRTTVVVKHDKNEKLHTREGWD